MLVPDVQSQNHYPSKYLSRTRCHNEDFCHCKRKGFAFSPRWTESTLTMAIQKHRDRLEVYFYKLLYRKRRYSDKAGHPTTHAHCVTHMRRLWRRSDGLPPAQPFS